jgi:hypothetical protein
VPDGVVRIGVLLCGGDEGTQERDIRKAVAMAEEPRYEQSLLGLEQLLLGGGRDFFWLALQVIDEALALANKSS